MYQPKTGEKCSCHKGIQRDNCPDCEGTGTRIDFRAIREKTTVQKIARHLEYHELAAMATEAFAEPGASNLVDLINPFTGKSAIYAETLEKVRERYPTAEVVNVEEWLKAKAAKQDSPVIWSETTEEKYIEMLEVLPPAFWKGNYFLVGEPCDHHATTGRPRYQAFSQIGEKYFVASRPMTVQELKDIISGA